jgi:hypothetical protein
VVSAADPLRSLISGLKTGAATFFFQAAPHLSSQAEWAPFQTHCCSENERGTSVSAATTADHWNIEPVQICVPRVQSDEFGKQEQSRPLADEMLNCDSGSYGSFPARTISLINNSS